jgi:hypothetical protein
MIMEGQNPEYQGPQTSRLLCNISVLYFFITADQEIDLLPSSGERIGHKFLEGAIHNC